MFSMFLKKEAILAVLNIYIDALKRSIFCQTIFLSLFHQNQKLLICAQQLWRHNRFTPFQIAKWVEYFLVAGLHTTWNSVFADSNHTKVGFNAEIFNVGVI